MDRLWMDRSSLMDKLWTGKSTIGSSAADRKVGFGKSPVRSELWIDQGRFGLGRFGLGRFGLGSRRGRNTGH